MTKRENKLKLLKKERDFHLIKIRKKKKKFLNS